MGISIYKVREMKVRIERVKSLCKELSEHVGKIMCDALMVNGGISAPIKKAICNNLTTAIDLCNIIPGIIPGISRPEINDSEEESAVPPVKVPGVGVMQ